MKPSLWVFALLPIVMTSWVQADTTQQDSMGHRQHLEEIDHREEIEVNAIAHEQDPYEKSFELQNVNHNSEGQEIEDERALALDTDENDVSLGKNIHQIIKDFSDSNVANVDQDVLDVTADAPLDEYYE